MCCQIITYRMLSKMANRAKSLESTYIKSGLITKANKMHLIWCRIASSMLLNIKTGGPY